MEKLSKTNQSPPKQAKKARRRVPVKVVYISNPVWVEATAAEFRARVIELTGRDSDIANISPVNFHEPLRLVLAIEADPSMYMAPFNMMNKGCNPHVVDNLSMFYGTFGKFGPSLDHF